MMRLEFDSSSVAFWSGDQLAGRYVIADDFKPYLHPLNTPEGHTVSLVSPHDHKHHKGMMYALRVSEVNFWEERSTSPEEVPGQQRHDSFLSTHRSGPQVGFDETLTWLPLDSGDAVFSELRSLSCRNDESGSGFVWTWSTEIEAKRDVDLTMSQWSATTADGRLVNYHGLGIRFRRDFGCTGGNRLLIDGVPRPFSEGMGTTPNEAEFQGSIDGTWPVRMASVRMRQEQQNGLFVIDAPFAFMGMGPSNLAPVQLVAGQKLVERYIVTVSDVTTT